MSQDTDYSRNIPKLRAIRMLFFMHFFSAVLMPFYTDWGGLSLAQAMLLNSWFMLWNFLLEVPTGTVADFLGRKASLVAGSLIGACAALLYVSAPRFAVFLAAEFVFAIAYTLHSGADEALAYDSLAASGRTDEARRILASMESFKLGGIIAGTTAGSIIAARFGYAAPMALYALPACLAGAIALTLNEPPVREPGRRRPGYLAILTEGGRHFLHHRVLLLLTAELALTNGLAWGLIWLFQPLLARAGLPVAWYGMVHAAACLGQILFLSRFEAIEAILGSRRALLTSAAHVSGAAFLILGLTTSLPLTIAAVVAGFSFSLPRLPIFSAYLNRYIPSDRRATVLSLTSMCRTLAIVVLNPLIGLLADHSLTAAMLLLGSGLILVTVFSRVEEHHLAD